MSFSLSSLVLVLVFVLQVLAESHTIRFQNNCGSGTPKLIKGQDVLSTGEDYTSSGPLESSIAYLDRDGECQFNGENCTLVEMNMNNPSCPGCGSSVDISLIPTHAFNVPTSFSFFGGNGDICDGLGAACADANCNTAFFVPDDTFVQRACQANDVNLLITFCDSKQTEFTEAAAGSLLELTKSLGSGSGGSSSGDSSSSTEEATVSESTPSSSSSSSVPAASQTGIVNVAASSSVPSSTITSTSSASSPVSTCSRKRSARRSKRNSTAAHNARSHRRARAFGGMHGSNF